MGIKKQNKQTSLFQEDSNLISMEEFKKISAKRTQHEKKFMGDLIKAAYSMGLPCFHIDYYCGNKFYARCSCNASGDSPVFCSFCNKPILVECHNTLNKNLSGHFDIIGIGWAIETKHKINKGKQTPKESSRQKIKKEVYEKMGVPNIIVNESGNQEALTFLLEMREKYVMNEKTHADEGIFRAFFKAREILKEWFEDWIKSKTDVHIDLSKKTECFLESVKNIIPGKHFE